MRRRVYKLPPYENKKTVGEKLTIGLDLRDRRHHACILDEAGEILAEEVIVNTREVLTVFFARYLGATVVMETGTHCSTRCPQAFKRAPVRLTHRFAPGQACGLTISAPPRSVSVGVAPAKLAGPCGHRGQCAEVSGMYPRI
jgi:hypothetical protein